jgi:hypothetical protein
MTRVEPQNPRVKLQDPWVLLQNPWGRLQTSLGRHPGPWGTDCDPSHELQMTSSVLQKL